MEKKLELKKSNSNKGKMTVNKNKEEKRRFNDFKSSSVSSFNIKNHITSIINQGKIPNIIIISFSIKYKKNIIKVIKNPKR